MVRAEQDPSHQHHLPFPVPHFGSASPLPSGAAPQAPELKSRLGHSPFGGHVKTTRRAPDLGAHPPSLRGQDAVTLQGLPRLSSPSGALARGHSGHFGARLAAGALGAFRQVGPVSLPAPGHGATPEHSPQPSPWPSAQRRGEQGEPVEPHGAKLRWSRPGSSPPGPCRPHRRTSGRSCAWPCRARCPSRREGAWGTRRPSCRRTRTPC